MSRSNIFDSSPARVTTKRKTSSYTVGDHTADCWACPGSSITRRTQGLSGCDNYAADGTGCNAKIVHLLAPAPCKTCAKNIVAGQAALGVGRPGTGPDSSGKFKEYDNNHWEWRQCLGKLLNLPGGDGRQTPAYVIPCAPEDERVKLKCAKCSKAVKAGEPIISTWTEKPLHAKCAKAQFEAFQKHFKDGMLSAHIHEGAIDVKDLGFDF